MYGGGSAVADPYVISGADTGLYILDGRGSPISPVLAAEATGVFLCGGQSLICNTVNDSYSVVNAKNQNFCIQNGGIYTSQPTLLGCSANLTGCFLTRLADKLITAGKYARVIMVPIGIDGTLFSEWAAGGQYNHRIVVAAKRLAAVGLVPTGVLWQQGESDSSAGTSQATCTTQLNSIISTFRNNGVNCKIALAKSTWIGGSQPAGATAVLAAVAAVVNGTTVVTGPDTNTLDNTNRYDTTHLNATGSDANAGLWQTVINANF